jgi:subtilase family serine protease
MLVIIGMCRRFLLRLAAVVGAAVLALALVTAQPAAIATATAAAGAGGAASADNANATATAATASAPCSSVATCYTPRQLETAYGVTPLLNQGTDGRGRTVVLPELAVQPGAAPAVSDVRQDLELFDTTFGLPAADVQVDAGLADTGTPWLANQEEVQDVEIVHAIAPGAALRIVLLPSTALSSTATATAGLTAALWRGMAEGDVISVSAGWGEHCLTSAEVASMHQALRAAAARGVTVVAASGDTGAVSRPCLGSTGPWDPVKEVNMPAADPFVLAAGGTTLTADHQSGTHISETAFSDPAASRGSGGGFSTLFPRPAYQDGVPGAGTARAVPDVAADADAVTGMAVVVDDGNGQSTVFGGEGTSASAPLWAGVVALADQCAGRDLGLVDPAIYAIGSGPAYRFAFHDVTTGTNTVVISSVTIPGYAAGPGWDPVTGWGSPDAAVLVPLLSRV